MSAFTLSTDEELLAYWNRNYVPWPDEIITDDKVALMTQRAFDRLPEYHVLEPFLVPYFAGKRWKEQAGRFVQSAQLQPHWVLAESHGFGPGLCYKFWDIVIV